MGPAGQHDVTQAQMVPMFLYNPLVHPIKQTITPWQIHFNKAPCYYGTRCLPEDESYWQRGQATVPTQLSSSVPSAEWLTEKPQSWSGLLWVAELRGW